MPPDGQTELDSLCYPLDTSLSSASLHSWNLFRKRAPTRGPLEPAPARARSDERGRTSGISRSNARARKEDERWARRGTHQRLREGGRHNGNVMDGSSSSVPVGTKPDTETSHRRRAQGRASETTDNLCAGLTARPSTTIAEHHHEHGDLRKQYHHQHHFSRQLRTDQDPGALTFSISTSASVESFHRSASRNVEQHRPLSQRAPFLGNLIYQHEAAMEARDRLDERLRSRALRSQSDEDARRYDEMFDAVRQDHLALFGLQARLHMDFVSSSVSQSAGLSKAAIKHLHRDVFVPKETVRDKAVEDMKMEPSEQDDCSVCLEHFLSGQLLICLPCKHRFHPDCVTPWLETHGQCPYCRANISSQGKGKASTGDSGGTGYTIPPSENIFVGWR